MKDITVLKVVGISWIGAGMLFCIYSGVNHTIITMCLIAISGITGYEVGIHREK